MSNNDSNQYADSDLNWNKEATQQLNKLPGFVRGKVKRDTEKIARERGLTEITLEVMYEGIVKGGKSSVPNNSKKNLITWGIIFLLIGGGAFFANQRTVCMLGECILITEGKDLLSYRGIKLSQTTSGLISTSAYIGLGLGGVFLLAGLIKPDNQ
jgi:hypothetical protein